MVGRKNEKPRYFQHQPAAAEGQVGNADPWGGAGQIPSQGAPQRLKDPAVTVAKVEQRREGREESQPGQPAFAFGKKPEHDKLKSHDENIEYKFPGDFMGMIWVVEKAGIDAGQIQQGDDHFASSAAQPTHHQPAGKDVDRQNGDHQTGSRN
jgi:hypothetical protein